MAVETKQGLNPKTTHFEFSGTVGTFVLTFGLPLLVNVLCVCCTTVGYSLAPSHIIPQWKKNPFLKA